MKKPILNKLQQKQGETIVEVLMALLVAVLCIMFMTNAILTGKEINERSEDSTIGFRYKEGTSETGENLHDVSNPGTFQIVYKDGAVVVEEEKTTRDGTEKVKVIEKKDGNYSLNGKVYSYNSYASDDTSEEAYKTIHIGGTNYYYAVTGG